MTDRESMCKERVPDRSSPIRNYLLAFFSAKYWYSLIASLRMDESSPEVTKFFSYSTQLSTKFQLLIKTKIPTNKKVSCFKSLRCCIYNAYKS